MYAPDLMDCFTSNIIPDAAYIWACKTRIHISHNNIVKTEFDLLGYNLNLERLKLSKKPIKPCKAKIVKLIKLRAVKKRLEQYWLNWARWATDGLNNHIINIAVELTSCHF